MRILFLSNFWPPFNIGGYELLCLHVAEKLEERGHQAIVLTSTFGVNEETVDGKVHRLLSLEGDLYGYRPTHAWRYPAAQRRNRQHFRRIITTFQPDIIFIWGMWNLSKYLAAEAETLLGPRVVYYLANPWPIEPNMHQAYWDMPAEKNTRKLAKRALRIPARIILKAEWESVPLLFEHAPCCSLALRDQLLATGVPLGDAPVIYEGIDLGPHLAQPIPRDEREDVGALSLVLVGNLARHKGVPTAIEALARLPIEKKRRASLTILGAGHPEYEAQLHSLVEAHNLSAQITFKHPIPRSELPGFLGQFDVLLLPSIWEEPLALIMQESLANGLVVVGSSTGGTKEIIVDGENGLLFAPEDAVELAHKIERLAEDPPLRQRLATAGRNTAIEKFNITRMVDQLETYLSNVYASAVPV